jgi:hypothetical protein
MARQRPNTNGRPVETEMRVRAIVTRIAPAVVRRSFRPSTAPGVVGPERT